MKAVNENYVLPNRGNRYIPLPATVNYESSIIELMYEICALIPALLHNWTLTDDNSLSVSELSDIYTDMLKKELLKIGITELAVQKHKTGDKND